LVYCLLFSLFIVASFIDFEYYIIPDEITLGGLAAGFLCSFAVPSIQHATSSTDALLRSLGGIILGSGLVYLILRGGKVLFGRQRFSLPADTTVTFTETVLKLPDRDVPYEELFYRKSDAILFRAKKLELFLAKSHHATSDLNPPTASSPPSKDIIPTNPPDESPEETAPRPDATGLVQPAATGPGATLASESAPPPHTGPGPAEIPKSDASQHADHTFDEVLVRLTPHELCVGETIFKPDEVTRMIAVAEEMVLPREAMGLGDVKFMASIGAFLGAPAVLFSLLLSAMIGSLVGVTLIVLRRREWSSRLPYGPYLALAAMIWVFGSIRLHNWWVDQLNLLLAATGIAR
jgi:prepilin signal peptidase PulO-like enzyme (type II secretory pathway)